MRAHGRATTSALTRGIGEVTEALSSSLDLQLALERAYPLLLQLLSADSGALAVSALHSPEGFTWTVSNLPPAFFAAYAEMAAHDFVRDAVASRPNVALLDEDMLDRRALERHPLYQRSREVGAGLEQVMAVMLPVGNAAQSGLALYRHRKRPFANRERATLQRLTTTLANTVRNCAAHEHLARRADALDLLTERRQLATLLLSTTGRELERSAAVTPLLSTWFSASERSASGLPTPLLRQLAPFVRAVFATGSAPAPWQRRVGDQVLQVSFVPVTQRTPQCWLLDFQVYFRPAWCEALTPRQVEVLRAVAEGWDNQFIAQRLHCAEETVKKHVGQLLQRSGYDNRTMLAANKYEL